MFLKKTFLLFGILSSFIMYNCSKEDDHNTDPATPIPSRLIFTAIADLGGNIKVELLDPKLEAILDGDLESDNNAFTAVTPLPPRASNIKIDITDLYYYGETISISCNSDESNKIQLEWMNSDGSYFSNNGVMFLLTGVVTTPPPTTYNYYRQTRIDAFKKAIIPNPYGNMPEYYYIDCDGSDGNGYRVAFYPSEHPNSHGIITTFDLETGALEGIIRVRRIGDGYDPFIMDIML